VLIQKTIRMARAQLVAFPFGARAAKPGSIGRRLLFRLFPRCALPELFQINQIPHVASVMLIADLQQQAEGTHVVVRLAAMVARHGKQSP
jgi:hypothetical protein